MRVPVQRPHTLGSSFATLMIRGGGGVPRLLCPEVGRGVGFWNEAGTVKKSAALFGDVGSAYLPVGHISEVSQ